MNWHPGDRQAVARYATRSPVMAHRGLISTSQPLASAAGLAVFQEGGNAIDAAVTAAATLSVVEPTMTGVGGDLFALLHNGRSNTTHALNASGRSPHGASLDALRDAVGPSLAIPEHGPLSVSIPGAVDGWDILLARHGTISLSRALQPAIHYARFGFAVSEVVSHQWRSVEPLLSQDEETASLFLPSGRAPLAGDTFCNPALALTLERIATDGSRAFYKGPVAEQIADCFAQRNGWLNYDDLAAHHSDWVEPLTTTFFGRDVLELPPNTQGLTAIEILNLISGYDLERLGHNSAGYLHLLIESIRIAFADRTAHLADSDSVPQKLIQKLSSPDYAKLRRRDIDPKHAAENYRACQSTSPTPASSTGGTGDTVYLAAADEHGNVISLIQSLFGAFGSGVVSKNTGIVFQNRASLFSSDPSHPNKLEPHKRPFHTLIPAMTFEKGLPTLSFGVMGGDMQAQGHAQVLVNLFVFGMNLQDAGDAARARWTGNAVACERGVSSTAQSGLTSQGHRLSAEQGGFGGFQGVLIDQRRGVLVGGSDGRKDGISVGW